MTDYLREIEAAELRAKYATQVAEGYLKLASTLRHDQIRRVQENNYWPEDTKGRQHEDEVLGGAHCARGAYQQSEQTASELGQKAELRPGTEVEVEWVMRTPEELGIPVPEQYQEDVEYRGGTVIHIEELNVNVTISGVEDINIGAE